ncbi:MAG: sugar phosphate isomerase/epimerase [Gemmatales bacterium]|nr:sugar phosphate isomerase/epimerase [Gemmatales bacterium]MDW8387607.1 sugar phosphate isomerase/epimerase family protein [Gemmatales bacterium]
MARNRIGAVLESLQLPIKEAVRVASTLGIEGVQVDAVGDLAPEALSSTGRREFRHRLRSVGLELAALGCPLRHPLYHLERYEARVKHVMQALSLAYDLGAGVVTIFAGTIPNPDDPARTILTDTLERLGSYGERVGATLALAAGAEPPQVLADYLRTFRCGGLGVFVDPASLLMRRMDPSEAVRLFKEQLALLHARDALSERPDRLAEEVPLGHGDVDWMGLLGALEEIDYRGWIVIRRGQTPDPAADIRNAAALLRRLGA